ncbi:hypothetical protein Ndes2526B_g02259 [Nannochloris sp. 'desiccata']
MSSGQDLAGQVPPNPIPDHPRYTMVSYVNRGRHGFVLRAVDKLTGQEVAIKFLERSTGDSKYVSREILNQYKLCHPHVIGLLDVFLTPRFLALVLEYANFGDLHSYVMSRRGLSEPEARWFFQQLMLAVDFCHQMGVVNRDIKLENTLLVGDTRPLIKISDFGFSKDEHGQSAPTTRVGTVMYMAPEVVSNGPDAVYDAKKSRCMVLWSRSRSVARDVEAGSRASVFRSKAFLKHPWYKEGLSPGVEGYNQSVVSQALEQQSADDPSLNRIKAVLTELEAQSHNWRRESLDE